MRRGFLAFAVLVSLPAVWLACVGDDPVSSSSSGGTTDGGKSPGERGGPCYPNGTCNAPLKCRDIGEGETLCLTEDEPIPPRDGGGDADANVIVDAGTDAPPTICPTSAPDGAVPSGPACPEGQQSPCGVGAHCCTQPTFACVSPGSCTASAWECDTDSHCPIVDGGQQICCAGLQQLTDFCPGVARYSVSTPARCQDGISCAPGYRMCKVGDFCGGGVITCKPAVIERNGKQLQLGTCRLTDGG